jgi:hypothetical protein
LAANSATAPRAIKTAGNGGTARRAAASDNAVHKSRTYRIGVKTEKKKHHRKSRNKKKTNKPELHLLVQLQTKSKPTTLK